ncbi:hypothetical protein FWF74_02890 [Candidatus Saccharibacteria bacterium]|nr:hypothetical protein [Candidatus Saccharibacteria bacterium]MCL1962664.1 hypothetical protein [Candidatus Saccharibacteria bacterium]
MGGVEIPAPAGPSEEDFDPSQYGDGGHMFDGIAEEFVKEFSGGDYQPVGSVDAEIAAARGAEGMPAFPEDSSTTHENLLGNLAEITRENVHQFSVSNNVPLGIALRVSAAALKEMLAEQKETKEEGKEEE